MGLDRDRFRSRFRPGTDLPRLGGTRLLSHDTSPSETTGNACLTNAPYMRQYQKRTMNVPVSQGKDGDRPRLFYHGGLTPTATKRLAAKNPSPLHMGREYGSR